MVGLKGKQKGEKESMVLVRRKKGWRGGREVKEQTREEKVAKKEGKKHKCVSEKENDKVTEKKSYVVGKERKRGNNEKE